MVAVAGSASVIAEVLAKDVFPTKKSEIKVTSRTLNQWRRENIPDFLDHVCGKPLSYKSAAGLVK